MKTGIYSHIQTCAIPTKSSALSLTNRMQNDNICNKTNYLVNARQTHQSLMIYDTYDIGICSLASASALAPSSPIELPPR